MKKRDPSPLSLLLLILLLPTVTEVFAQREQAGEILIYLNSEKPPIHFGATRISQAFRFGGQSVSIHPLENFGSSGNSSSFVLLADREDREMLGSSAIDYPSGILEEGFSLARLVSNSAEGWLAYGNDTSGVMYGALEIAEHVAAYGSLQGLTEKKANPRFPVRALKHNLPWSSYRVHESINLHYQTCRDLEYWQRLLDMMAENRLNVLTLWSLHPWPFMIRPENFPNATPLSDEELEDWQAFWHSLFRMARNRGVKTYMVNWNIWVSPKFALMHNTKTYNITRHYNGKGDYSELVQRYNRECVTQVLREYPELTGIAISANERMGGVSDQEMEDWIVDTYLGALDDAGRPVQFMHRGHTHPDPAITRAAIEENADRLPETVWVPLKFNWSHGHATSDLVYIHGGSESDVWWTPPPRNYKVIWTIRNEDFFVLRWGQSDFIREIIARNGADYVGGFQIGSETYLPAKEYITRPGPHLNWDYGFEKQWLFYMMWGRLLYDPTTPDAIFSRAFDRRYSGNHGTDLIKAHNLADQMPLRLASLFSATWDFTLYSEGFLSGYYPWRGGYYDNVSPFLSIEELINNPPLDPDYVSIKEFVEHDGEFTDHVVTPDRLADQLIEDSRGALSIVDSISTDDPTLQHEIADIKAWSYLGLYFGRKIRAGIALEKFRKDGDENERSRSVLHLEQAATYWDQLIKVTEPYFDSMPLLHFGDDFYSWQFEEPVSDFSWKAFRDQVQRDIELVREARVGVRPKFRE